MPFYGYRRLAAALNRSGYLVNHKKVLRLMKEMNICALYPRHNKTIKKSDGTVYPYLLNDIEIIHPNQVWQTDITYIKLQHGFMYLVALIDFYSRYIVSWELSNTLDTSFCLKMLENGLLFGRPEILNSDHGSQFTSKSWIELLCPGSDTCDTKNSVKWASNVQQTEEAQNAEFYSAEEIVSY